MGRPLKWIFGIIGGVIIIVVVAVVIILSTYDFNDLKPLITKAVYNATGRELVIGSDIDLNIGFTPSLVLSDIEFQNADWGSQKEMAKIGQFEVKVALIPLIRGNIDVKRFILRNPDILIETDKNGKGNYEFKTPEKTPAAERKPEVKTQEKEEAALPPLTINEFEIINGTLTYRDGKTGKTEKVTLKKLTAGIRGLDKPVTFNLSGGYNDAPFEVSGTLGSIKEINDPAVAWPVDITAKAFGVISSIKGSIKNPKEQQGINIDFDVKIDDWNKLSKIAGQEIPVKDPLNVSGNVADSAPKSYQVKGLKISLGKNRIEGSVGADLSGKVPFIDASLSSEELDLRSLISEEEAPARSAEKTGQAPSEAKKSEKIFSDEPLPLDSLRLVNGKFKVRFNRIIMPQMVISNLAVDSTMNNGNLYVKPLRANMGGGSINLETTLLSKGNEADLATILSVREFDIADMLAEAGSKYSVEGSIDADIDISGRGKSVASIMAGLNGFLKVIVGEGKIDNKIIDKLGGNMSKNIIRLLNPSIDEKKFTTFKCMVTRFDIQDGIADATALAIDTSMMSVIGEGSINLKNETLSLSLDPSTKGGVAGYNLELGELSQPFKLGGTLAEPSLKLDKNKTVAAIGKLISDKLLKDKTGTRETAAGEGSKVDVCAAALQAAETGVKMTSGKASSAKEESQPVTTEKLIEDVKKNPEKAIKDVIKDPKKALKDLFGK